MHIAHVDDEEGEIWFLTGKGGCLAEEIQKSSMTLLVFQNENSSYLSLRGLSRITQDSTKIKELWKEPYKVWFPQGPDDPEIAVVSFDPVEAEYWDNRGMNKLKYMFEAARAYIKGQTPDVSDTEQHGKAKL
jgi:general stress protein 26